MVAMPSRFAVSMARTMLLEFPLVEITIATSPARPTSAAKYDQFVARVQPVGQQKAHFCDLVYRLFTQFLLCRHAFFDFAADSLSDAVSLPTIRRGDVFQNPS